MRKLIIAAAIVAVTSGLMLACPLSPAKTPCTGRETYPDPCAAGARDAGAE